MIHKFDEYFELNERKVSGVMGISINMKKPFKWAGLEWNGLANDNDEMEFSWTANSHCRIRISKGDWGYTQGRANDGQQQYKG